jgi:hypothetical protein
MKFDSNGKFVQAFGANMFVGPHGFAKRVIEIY